MPSFEERDPKAQLEIEFSQAKTSDTSLFVEEVISDPELRKLVLEYRHTPQFMFLKLANGTILRFYADNWSPMAVSNSIKRATSRS